MNNLVLGMNCPNCGGRVEVQEGESLAICPNCNAAHAIVGDEGVRKVMYRLAVDRNQAMQIVFNWFQMGYKARDLKAMAQFTEVYPLYLPFWRMRATGKGIVCGYEWVYTNNDRRKKYLEKEINQDYEWTEIACDAGDIGVVTLRNLAGEIIPYQEGEIPTFEATTSQTDSYRKAKDSIAQMTYEAVKVENVTFSRIFVIPRTFSLIFYPFWIVRYNYKGRGYFATVDGVTGQVIAGRAPGDPLWQSLAMAGGCTLGGAITGGMVVALGEPVCMGISAILGIGLTIASYNFFRHGSEIIEGDLPKPGGEVRTGLEGLGDLFNLRIGGI